MNAPAVVRVRDIWGVAHWVRLDDLTRLSYSRLAWCIVIRRRDGAVKRESRRRDAPAAMLHRDNIAAIEDAAARHQVRRAWLSAGRRYVTGGAQQREHSAMGWHWQHKDEGYQFAAGGPIDAPDFIPAGGVLDRLVCREV